MKINLLAVTVKRSRVELFTQWYYCAEFTALVGRFIIAVIAEKVYNSTAVKITISQLFQRTKQSGNGAFLRLVYYVQ